MRSLHTHFVFLKSAVLLGIVSGWVLLSTPPAGAEQGSSSPEQFEPIHHDQARFITSLLVAEGMSRVGVAVSGDECVVAFENTRYRDPHRALTEISAVIVRERPGCARLVLIPSLDRIPLASTMVAVDAADRGDTPADPQVSPEVKTSLPASIDPHHVGLDIVVHPWLEASFGRRANPVATRSAIAPELVVPLGPGMRLAAEILFTLQDDIPTDDSRVRPGTVTLGRWGRLPGNVLVAATVGTFTLDRYGADVEARRWSDDRAWSLGAEVGRTGSARYTRGGWRVLPLNSTTALLDVGRRLDRWNLLVRTTAGRFPEGEHGLRVDVRRQFGELEIGWFATETTKGANGGVTLRIPLLPRAYPRRGRIRVRTAEAFQWEYQYHRRVPAGQRYRTGATVFDIEEQLFRRDR